MTRLLRLIGATLAVLLVPMVLPWSMARADEPSAPAEGLRTEVDLALVLAVDVSYSMDPDEQALQREGFVEAFRSALVKDAIGRGQLGRIAVTYFEWAGAGDQRTVLPWTLIDGPASANAFADALTTKPTRRASRTSISGALDYATKLIGEAPFDSMRRVIDVSGDGPNNSGRPIQAARADTLARGITVNGLPLMLKAPGYYDIPDLDLYYRDCVIGGVGAFMVPVRDRDQFREAVKTKIVLEVASADVARRYAAAPPPDRPGIILAQAGGGANCLAGEALWRDRMGN